MAIFFFFFNFALIYVMTSIIYSNISEKFAKIQRDTICNPCFAQLGMNSNISKV